MIALLSLLLAAPLSVAAPAQTPPATAQQTADSISVHLTKHPKQKVERRTVTAGKRATKGSETSAAAPSSASRSSTTPAVTAPAPTAVQQRTPAPVLSKRK